MKKLLIIFMLFSMLFSTNWNVFMHNSLIITNQSKVGRGVWFNEKVSIDAVKTLQRYYFIEKLLFKKDLLIEKQKYIIDSMDTVILDYGKVEVDLNSIISNMDISYKKQLDVYKIKLSKSRKQAILWGTIVSGILLIAAILGWVR